MSKYSDNFENKQRVDDPWGYQEDPNEDELIKDFEEGPNQFPPSAMTPQPPASLPPRQKEVETNPFSEMKGPNDSTSKPAKPQESPPKKSKAKAANKKQKQTAQNNSTPQTNPTQKDNMLTIVKSQDVFLDQDKIPYVSIVKGASIKDVPIKSDDYEAHLMMEYVRHHGSVPADVRDAMKLSRAFAITNEKILPVHTRFHFDGQTLLLDLCDGNGNIVHADRSGWRVVHKGLNKFYQPAYMKPLPIPDENGDIMDLFGFLNFDSPMDKVLAAIWIVTALASNTDRPILLISGTQGAGKTTAADIIRSCIDPVNLSGLGTPSTERDFAVTLRRQQVPSFDNLTFIKGGIQDLMARVVTGGSIERCKLYTDNDSSFISFKRAMILTAISNPITQDDLLDRTLSLKLRRFTETERKLKADIKKQFELKHASILGGILDTFVGALKIMDTLNPEELKLPRLADFYFLGLAAAEFLGESKGFGKDMFAQSVTHAMRQSYSYGVDDDPLSYALLDFLRKQQDTNHQASYCYKISDLHNDLKQHASGIEVDPKELPGSPSILSRKLKGVQQALEHMGWGMTFGKGPQNSYRTVTFRIRKNLET